MKPESHAWLALNNRAAALLHPRFADRVLRAAREAAPTLASQFALSAATAAVCLAVVCFVHNRMVAHETARNLAAWQEFAAEAQQFGQLP